MYMEQTYRSLTKAEIKQLCQQGCMAEDWQEVTVHPDFKPDAVVRTTFQGTVRLGCFLKDVETESRLMRPSGIRDATLINVSVGNNCLIEHIGTYIANYDIGDECCLSDVGVVQMLGPSRFGNALAVPVLSETEKRYTVTIHQALSVQEALMQLSFPEIHNRWQTAISFLSPKYYRGRIESHCQILRTREITSTFVGEWARVTNALELVEVTINSSLKDPVRVANNSILRRTIVCSGAIVVDGARLQDCFVGQHSYIGLGFSATNSLFFANCHMENGEACSVFAGPFSVSHHKNTLLIGCRLAFANMGSGTNMSNHLYKMGPVHHGTLESGCKTASGAHIVWPAHIGAFSMVMGKVACHPDTSDFPFSYLFGEDNKVWLVPGANCFTYGTFRDMHKWEERDFRRKGMCLDTIYTYGMLNPVLIAQVQKGLRRLESLSASTTDDVVTMEQVYIRRTSLAKGIKVYRRMLTLLWGEYFMQVGRHYLTGERQLPADFEKEADLSQGWTDLCGLPMPVDALTRMADCMREVPESEAHEEEFYDTYRRMQSEATDRVDHWFRLWQCSPDGISDKELLALMDKYTQALAEWRDDVMADLRKEAAFPDVDPEELVHAATNLFEHFYEKIAETDKILQPLLQSLCK